MEETGLLLVFLLSVLIMYDVVRRVGDFLDELDISQDERPDGEGFQQEQKNDIMSWMVEKDNGKR